MADDTALLSAQSTRPTPEQAIEKFKDLIDDEDFVRSGQFIWAVRYRQELQKLAKATAQTDPALNRFWNSTISSSSPSFLDDLIATAIHPIKRDVFRTLRKTALADASMNTGSPATRILRGLLQGRVDNGVATYDRATRLLATGTAVSPVRTIAAGPRPGPRNADPDFAIIFNPAGLTFPGALSITNRAKDRCFDMTNAVCNYIGNRGGLTIKPELHPQGQPVNGKPAPAPILPKTKPAKSPGQLFEGTRTQGLPDPGFTRFLSPLRDLIRYGGGLASQVKTATTALDRGHLLNAAVLSGARLDNRIASPDHFLPIIAWESFDFPMAHVRFVFWDPDAKVTNAIEPGFGRLFFLAAPEAQAEVSSNSGRGRVFEDNNPGFKLGKPPLPSPPPKNPYSAAFWKNGRLTTAREDRFLDTDDSGTDPNNQHRYQITALTALPGEAPLPKRRKGQ